MELLKEYKWWIVFIIGLGVGILFLNNKLDNEYPKPCNNNFNVGDSLNKAILKEAWQIWVTPQKEVFIVYNALRDSDDVNNHLLYFNSGHKLTGEITFNSIRIEAISDSLVLAKWWHFAAGAGLNCPGDSIGRYTVKYQDFKLTGSGRDPAKLIDSISIDPKNYDVTFYYRQSRDPRYQSIDGDYLLQIKDSLTERKDTVIHLKDLFFEKGRYFYDFTEIDGDESWDKLMPINQRVYNSFFDQLEAILFH